MTDLDGVKQQLEALGGKLDILITRVETRIPLADGFDDRLARVEILTEKLGNTALKLATARMLTSWVPGAIAGAVAGGAVALALLGLLGGVALAH
jgi:hypothetical protein